VIITDVKAASVAALVRRARELTADLPEPPAAGERSARLEELRAAMPALGDDSPEAHAAAGALRDFLQDPFGNNTPDPPGLARKRAELGQIEAELKARQIRCH
jgi:hypothetical protein